MKKDKVRVSGKELAEAITFLRPFIPDAAVISAFRRMAWSGRSMVGQDGIVGAMITGPLAAPIKGVTLEGPKMLAFLNAMGKEVDARFTDKSLIVTGAGSKSISRATFRYGMAEEAKYPIPTWPKKFGFKEVSGSFVSSLKMAEFCADSTGKAGPLGSVCVADGFAWATDGGRGVKVPIDIKTKEPMLIPMRTIKLIGDEDPLRWQLSGTMLWMSWKERHIWTRLLEPPFPDLGVIFEKTKQLAKKGTVVEYDTREITQALQGTISAGGFGVEGELEKNRLTFRCQGELTEVKISQSLSVKGNASFFADGGKLLDAFSRFSRMVVCGEGVLYFLDADTKAEHLVMELVKEAPREYEEETGTEEDEIPF